jgi:Ni2+-binding GTPase involved in maturation of urease and hydrogenase
MRATDFCKRRRRLIRHRSSPLLCKRLRDNYDKYVITNDIYTKEDQLILTRAHALPAERIMGVEGARVDVMAADALRMRVKRPFVFTNLKSGEGVEYIVRFLIERGGLNKEVTPDGGTTPRRFTQA